VEPFPANFLLWDRDGSQLEKAVRRQNPALVIIDTLRAYDPTVEGKNDDMGKFLNHWRAVAREEHCTVLLLHHPRKPGADDRVPSLEDTPVLEWLQQASGARALVNQTNTRIAFDRVRQRRIDAAFVMKSFIKSKGGTESIYIERVLDDDGEPIGYRSIVGIDLLDNPDQEAAFRLLPNEFRFKEAQELYGRAPDPTTKFLRKCIAAGLVRKVGHGQYERLVR
jgi:hypothetical protein